MSGENEVGFRKHGAVEQLGVIVPEPEPKPESQPATPPEGDKQAGATKGEEDQ